MSGFAKVTSTEAVERLASALDAFKEEAVAALDSLELEVRRVLEWICHDRKDFWDQEVRRGWNRVAEARAELERRMTYHRVGEHQPACRDEKLALEKAKRQLHTAEQKIEVVRRWRKAVEQELTEYQGAVNQLSSWLQSDHPRAMADLKRMTAALGSYVALGLPGEQRAEGAFSSGGEPPPAPKSDLEASEDEGSATGSPHDETMGL
jgi:chromosome segregation ATPase